MSDSVRQRRIAARTIKGKIVDRACAKKGFQKKWRLAIAFALTFASYTLYQWLPTSGEVDFAHLSEEEKDVLRKLEPSVIANLTAVNPHRLGRFCDSGGDCFIVEQRYWMTEVLHAQRLIMYELHDKMALTMAHLRVPEIVTPHHLVHERWRIDHSRLSWSYNLMQIAAGFALEGLSFNRTTPLQRVLQIGMGGGSATGYLATMPLPLHVDVVELEPEVYEAAKRWFDFPQSPNIVVHIQDGVIFAKEAAAKGITYDSLILDASSNSANASIVCPHPLFLEEDVLVAMSKVIGTHGVLSANLFMPDEQLRLQEEVFALFALHFRSCSSLVISSNGQKFLLCTNRSDRFDWTHHRDRILRNLGVFDAVMGTKVASFLDHLNPAPSDSNL